MSQFCFNKLLTEDETVVVSRGMPTLIDASVARSDEFADYLRSQKSVTIHVDCRKSYTRKTSISASKRQREEEQASTSKVSPPHTRARISESSFCFKNHCLFCGDEADEEAEKKKVKIYRRKIHKVSTLTFKDSILKLAKDRSDDVSKAVFARINFQYDLVAADAKYHDSCYKSFLRPNTGGKIGRQ
ncbi:unnamed protein product [Pieris brassicae]|uniref:Uncharacterized protein n=1 Tax=Pieris brassicae TaxID=7116 RepID=A0A9P0TDT3_PIEBR|nr:unnamed protein product [Pieris brassicae]